MCRQGTAVVERAGDMYVALCPKLDVASEGRTVEEARSSPRETIDLFFEMASPREEHERRRVEANRRTSLTLAGLPLLCVPLLMFCTGCLTAKVWTDGRVRESFIQVREVRRSPNDDIYVYYTTVVQRATVQWPEIEREPWWETRCTDGTAERSCSRDKCLMYRRYIVIRSCPSGPPGKTLDPAQPLLCFVDNDAVVPTDVRANWSGTSDTISVQGWLSLPLAVPEKPNMDQLKDEKENDYIARLIARMRQDVDAMRAEGKVIAYPGDNLASALETIARDGEPWRHWYDDPRPWRVEAPLADGRRATLVIPAREEGISGWSCPVRAVLTPPAVVVDVLCVPVLVIAAVPYCYLAAAYTLQRL